MPKYTNVYPLIECPIIITIGSTKPSALDG